MKRLIANISAVAAVSLLLVSASVWHRQQVQYREGLSGEKAANTMKAISGYESAIRMYTPFSATVERSAGRLWAIGEAAEKKGDFDMALAAYRSLRSSFYAVQWLRQPGEEWISKCDAKIKVLAPLRKKYYSAPAT